MEADSCNAGLAMVSKLYLTLRQIAVMTRHPQMKGRFPIVGSFDKIFLIQPSLERSLSLRWMHAKCTS